VKSFVVESEKSFLGRAEMRREWVKKSQAFDRTMNKEGMNLAAEPDQLVGQFLTWEQLDRSRV
jgi:hypothetical protein